MFERLFGKNKIETRDGDTKQSAWLSLFSTDYGTTSKSPLSISTAYACMKLKANTISSTRLNYYKSTETGNKLLKGNALTKLMKKPYMNMSYNIWMNTMVLNLDNSGNSYAHIIRDRNGRPKELQPLQPSEVSIMETFNELEPFYYQVTKSNKKTIKVFPEDMVHFKNISIDGITGISPIQQHKLLFDSAKGQDGYHKMFIENSAGLSGVIETEKKLSKEVVEELRDNFSSKFSGTKNAGKTPVLPEGMKYKQLNVMSPMDTDYINTKKYMVYHYRC